MWDHFLPECPSLRPACLPTATGPVLKNHCFHTGLSGTEVLGVCERSTHLCLPWLLGVFFLATDFLVLLSEALSTLLAFHAAACPDTDPVVPFQTLLSGAMAESALDSFAALLPLSSVSSALMSPQSVSSPWLCFHNQGTVLVVPASRRRTTSLKATADWFRARILATQLGASWRPLLAASLWRSFYLG